MELLGAVPELLPVLEIRPPTEWTPADAAVDRMRRGEYDWLVFTSTNGVAAFWGRLKTLGLDARAIGRARIAAIGSATAAALAALHLVPDLVPADEMRSERLAELLVDRCRGKRVLLVRACAARELLREQLGAVAAVDAIAVYEQAASVDPMNPVLHRLRRGEIDVVTLTSPNIARAFLNACDEAIRQRFRDQSTILLANSDRLANELKNEGYPAIVSADPTIDGLVRALKGIRQSRA